MKETYPRSNSQFPNSVMLKSRTFFYFSPSNKPKGAIRHIAILIRNRLSFSSCNSRAWDITSSKLRKDLTKKHTRLISNAIPTVLRVLGRHEYVPKTPSGKVLVKQAIGMYFPRTGDESVNEGFAPGVQV